MSELPPPPRDPSQHYAPDAPAGADALSGETYSERLRARGAGRRAALTWVTVLAAVAVIVGGHIVRGREAASAPPPEPVASDQAQQELMARALIGLHQWVRSSGQTGELLTQSGEAHRNGIDAERAPVIDLVRGAMVAGELDGAEGAHDLLDAASAALEGPGVGEKARGHLSEILSIRTQQQGTSPMEGRAEALAEALRLEREALRALRDATPMPGEQRDDSAYADGLREDMAALRLILEDGSAENLDPGAQQRLRVRHGFFGRAALAHGLAAGNADRDSIEAAGRRTLIVVGLAVTIGASAILIGFTLFIIALVLVARGRVTRRLPWQIRDLRFHHHTLVETFALFLWGFIAIAILGDWLHGRWGFDPSPILMWMLLPIMLWPLGRGVRGRELMMALGWHANGKGVAGVFKEMVCGLLGYLAGLPVLIFGVVVMFVLISLTHVQPSHPITQRIDTSWWGLGLLLLLASGWAPIVEETMFRGALLGHARTVMSSVLASALVGFVFAAIHPQGWVAIPPLMALGMVFGLIREWRGSLIGPVTMHAVHNGFIMCALVFSLR